MTLALILIVAIVLRLWHIDFGLPALNDPDEPLFVMTALDMLRQKTFNPHWFGHPATILFYALAAIFAAVGWIGTMLGHWSGTASYVAALYADPSIAILPMRLFIMSTGIGCILFTYRLGREGISPRAGLIAAALLACNGLHIELSQVIRTDMLAGLFMLWSSLHALRAARNGRVRDHLLTGVLLGLGGATKWPALLLIANAAGAIACRWRQAGWRRSAALLPVAPAGAMIALFMASPYLLLDWHTVLRDLSGEARHTHPGATGGSVLQNMGWYGDHILVGGFGMIGALLAAVGLILIIIRFRPLALASLPGVLLFFLGIVVQSLIWERWAVPLLPWVALCIAAAVDMIARQMRPRAGTVLTGVLLAALLIPMLSSALSRSRARAHDTRQLASQWVRAHVAPHESLLIEDAAFDLVDRPGLTLFPLGDAGCIDVRQSLKAPPSYRQAGEKRAGKAIVDLGNVAPAKLPGCRTDIAILTHYERYRQEAGRFPQQLAQYQMLLRGSRILASFRPIAGAVGGPVTYVVRMGPRNDVKF